MKYLLFCMSFIIFSNAWAQQFNTFDKILLKKYNPKNGQKFYLQNKPFAPANRLQFNMPILNLENKVTNKESVGKGNDLYVMNIDRMPCLVPDSTNHYSLPVLGGKNKESRINNR